MEVGAAPRARAVVALLLAASLATPAAAQTPHRPLPQESGIIIANAGSYESIYGQPVYYSLELLAGLNGSADPMAPANKSVITRGVYVAQAGPRLCTKDGNHCLALVPVPELASDVAFQNESHAGEEMEVTGAFQGGSILFWQCISAAPATQRKGAKQIPLEWLIHDPDRFASRTVVVRGNFRGRNLFAEMPDGSARTPQDWVLGDGPFFVWITGRAPRGSGFDLDASNRAEAKHRLEVEGRVEVVNGLIYVRAKTVRMIGREDGGEEAPP